MDSKDGGLSSAERQRLTVAELARNKVLAAYDKTPTSLKKTPVNLEVSADEWQKYHSAWQKYYQKYYSEYYTQAARQYVETEKLKALREVIETGAVSPEKEALVEEARQADKETQGAAGAIVSGGDVDVVADTSEVLASNLKKTVQSKARAMVRKKRRRGYKVIPIVAGILVVVTILFMQYNRLIFAPIMAYVSPSKAPETSITPLDPTIVKKVSAEPKLIIPKLNIEVPLQFGLSSDNDTIMRAMNNGVAHYAIPGANALPGQIGNTVVTGHSAGDIYSNNQYKFIFSGLERLEKGDLAYVNYDSVRYTYSVTKKVVVEPTDVAALTKTTSKPTLILVTCTPLGTSRYRLLVTAEQISPSYEDAVVAKPADGPTFTETEMPANEASFFEKVWGFLTNKR